MNEPHYSVPESWFKKLAHLADKAGQDIDNWYDEERGALPGSLMLLIGHASSARNIIKFIKKE